MSASWLAWFVHTGFSETGTPSLLFHLNKLSYLVRNDIPGMCCLHYRSNRFVLGSGIVLWRTQTSRVMSDTKFCTVLLNVSTFWTPIDQSDQWTGANHCITLIIKRTEMLVKGECPHSVRFFWPAFVSFLFREPILWYPVVICFQTIVAIETKPTRLLMKRSNEAAFFCQRKKIDGLAPEALPSTLPAKTNTHPNVLIDETNE